MKLNLPRTLRTLLAGMVLLAISSSVQAGEEIIRTSLIWSPPPNVKTVDVECIGGGGAGGSSTFNAEGGTGGSGAYAPAKNIPVSGKVRVTIGLGGKAGSKDGLSGGTSSFGQFVHAGGGQGGHQGKNELSQTALGENCLCTLPGQAPPPSWIKKVALEIEHDLPKPGAGGRGGPMGASAGAGSDGADGLCRITWKDE